MKKAGKGIFAPKALSPAMAAFTGKKSLPRTEVVKAIWKYIKAKSLNKGRMLTQGIKRGHERVALFSAFSLQDAM